MGNGREIAVTQGKIADILQARGQLDEALRILARKKCSVVHERLGNGREIAVTQGKIADILQARGQLDEALRIRQQEELPIFIRIGGTLEIAVTQGKIADILQARGQLDETLRILQQKVLPVHERLGNGREIAVTQGLIAGILQARGQLKVVEQLRRLSLTSQVHPEGENGHDKRTYRTLQVMDGIRLIGIDTAEKSFQLLGSAGARRLDSAEWEDYLTDPFRPTIRTL